MNNFLLIFSIVRAIISINPEPIEMEIEQCDSTIVHNVTATVYHAVPGQTDATPFRTASGARINKKNPYSNRYIALSRDLEKEMGVEFGDEIYVDCDCKHNGIWVFEDRMSKRWKKKVDLLVNRNEVNNVKNSQH